MCSNNFMIYLKFMYFKNMCQDTNKCERLQQYECITNWGVRGNLCVGESGMLVCVLKVCKECVINFSKLYKKQQCKRHRYE